ncbi:MAG: hypothetical protein HKN08_12305, partial [Gammaproteobacteria bacterium]|nr:hypothetical protein [Gammaproteobacteria bacterium]
LIIVTIPLAFIAFFYGSWRIATGALYFSLCCLIVSPLTWDPNLRTDLMLVVLMVIGVVMNGVMYWYYSKAVK